MMTRFRYAAAVLVAVATAITWTTSEAGNASAQSAGGWVCDAYDQSGKRGKQPEPDAAGRTYPIVTIHGITGSDGDFDGIIDQSYGGAFPQPPRSLFDVMAGVPGVTAFEGLPHAHVYSFSYTPDSLQWVDHDDVGGRFAATIDCLYELHGVPVSVVAHSMGGLVTRWVANTFDTDGAPRSSKLGKVVTLGTPYLGSTLAAVAGGASDGIGALSPMWYVLSFVCGDTGARTGSGSCGGVPLLASLNSPAGRALRAGSQQLSQLDRWPDVDAYAVAGSNLFEAKLFGGTIGSTDVGDLVVDTRSATADGRQQRVVTCRYDAQGAPGWDVLRDVLRISTPLERRARLGEFFVSRPCYHGVLTRNVEAVNEVLGELHDWIIEQARSAYPLAVVEFFRSTEPACRDHADRTQNSRVPAEFFAGAEPMEELAAGVWLIQDGAGNLLIVDTNDRVIHSPAGPSAELPHEYSFGCPEDLYLGTSH